MEHLIISAIAANKPMLLNELFLTVAKNECNVEESRITALGTELAIILEVTGPWNAIAKVESGVAVLKQEFISLEMKRTAALVIKEELLFYLVTVIAIKQPHIIYEVVNFFVQQGILIDDIESTTYAAGLSGVSMLTVNLHIGVPANLSITDFREQFAILCDELNLDGGVEPEKP